MTKLSIIVPVYNVEKYLPKCLDSLVHQSYEDFDVLVVNDGSTDASQDIIDQYAKKYPNIIKPLIKENGGLSDARNFGLNQSQSPYVAFVDSDDYVDLDLYALMMGAIENNEADIAVCDLIYEYEDGTQKISSAGDFNLIDNTSNVSRLNLNNSACNKVFRRELVLSKPFIKGIWYEDLATVPLIMLDAKTIVKIENSFYHYLQRESSIVHTQNMKIFDIYIALASIKEGIKNHSSELKSFDRLVLNQAVFLTNLRIKEYSTARKEYWLINHQRIEAFYKHWYLNPAVWNSGIKRWVTYSLFKFKQFKMMEWIYY